MVQCITSPAKPARTPLAKQLARWQSLLADLSHRDVELTVETTAPVIATFQALRRLGHSFDPMLVVVMDKLRCQLMDGQREGCIDDHEDSDVDCERSMDYPSNERARHITLSKRRIAVVGEITPERAARLAAMGAT